MRRLVAGSLAVGLLAGGLVFAAPVPAMAASGDFSPSGNKAREFMINILGSMLGPLTPNKWQREQIANQYQYNHSWEQFAAQTGQDPMDLNYLTAPSTPDEYKLAHTEQQLKGGKMGKPMKVPVTKMAKLVKGFGVASAVVVGAEYGFEVGKGVSSVMGFDVEGGLCAPNFEDGGLVALITQTDCSGFFDFAAGFEPNQDIVAGGLSAGLCDAGVTTIPSSGAPPTATSCGAAYATSDGVVVTYIQVTDVFFTPGTGWAFKVSAPAWSDGKAGVSSIANGFNMSRRCITSDGALTLNNNGSMNPQVPEAGIVSQTYQSPCLYGIAVWGASSTRVSGAAISPLLFGVAVRNGAPLSVVAPTDLDPERTLQCSVLGTDGNTYTAYSSPYRESGGKIAAPECPGLPDGVGAANIKIDENSPGGAVSLLDEPTTDEYQAWYTAYPECRTGACKLDLKKKDGAGVIDASCFDLDGDCVDWFTSPTKADEYQCTYGVHPVVLEECNVYEGVFKPERLAVGAAYSDPITGEWSGGQSSPTAGSQLMGSSVQNPALSRNCWTGGWATFNPVEWVMQPIQCAWEWAMVPRPAVVAVAFAEVQTAWQVTPPGVVVDTIGAWNLDLNINGCGGVPVTWQGSTVNMLEACPGSPLAPLAATSHGITSLLIPIGGILAIIGIVASVIGYRGLSVAGGNH